MNNNGIPCELCRVELKVENEEAARLYFLVRSQCETRWDGEKDIPIDLRHEALWKAIEKYPIKIKDQWGCFHKVLNAWREVREMQED